MKLKEGYQQEFQRLRSFLGVLAHENSFLGVLGALASYFGDKPSVALARVWVLGPGDRCDTCVLAADCRDRRLCLHLEATIGLEAPTDPESSRFLRVPLGRLKIGHAAATGEEVILPDHAADSPWILHPEWARRENVRGVAVLPLAHRDRVHGVLAVFTRMPLSEEPLSWLRLIADHGGAALARAVAFREMEQHAGRLDLEVRALRETPLETLAWAPEPTPVRTEAEMRGAERENLAQALAQCGGKVSGPGGAAELLGIRPTTLASRIKTLGLAEATSRPRPEGPRTRRAPGPETR